MWSLEDETPKAARVVAVYIASVLALSARDVGLPRVEAAALKVLRRVVA